MSEKLLADYVPQESPDDTPFTKAIRSIPQKWDASTAAHWQLFSADQALRL